VPETRTSPQAVLDLSDTSFCPVFVSTKVQIDWAVADIGVSNLERPAIGTSYAHAAIHLALILNLIRSVNLLEILN
jgi:hypothetical protein